MTKFEDHIRFGKLYGAGLKKVKAMFNDPNSFEKIMHVQAEYDNNQNDVYGVLGAEDIETLCQSELGMISPFLNYKISYLENGNKAISYGLSGAGYDIRCKALYRSILNPDYPEIDPKNPDTTILVPMDVFKDEKGTWVPLKPHGAYKGVSFEYFRMPTDIMGLCVGKSTLARVDTVQHITPIEPGWCGYLTMEIINASDYPVRFYLDEGICQVVFIPVSRHTQYKGHYQHQNVQKPYRATETPTD